VRPILARFFLAFALAFTQLGATVHAFSHIGAEANSKHYPGDTGQNCPICHAFSAASAVAPPSAPLPTLFDTDHVLWQHDAWSPVTLESFWFYARGPPRHPDA
jgi:hypothetical protein